MYKKQAMPFQLRNRELNNGKLSIWCFLHTIYFKDILQDYFLWLICTSCFGFRSVHVSDLDQFSQNIVYVHTNPHLSGWILNVFSLCKVVFVSRYQKRFLRWRLRNITFYVWYKFYENIHRNDWFLENKYTS